MERFLQRYRMRKNELPLKHFLVEPLSDREIKVVTIQFFNESVHEYDVETWLKRYCQVTSSSRKVVDRDGVWNGARQWLIQLFKDPEGIGGVRHLPSNVTLGAARGFVVYNGMLKLCRNCGQLGHLAQDVEREEEASKERTEEQQDEDRSLKEDMYSSEFSENEPNISAEEDNADDEMEIIQHSGDTSEVEVMEEAGLYADSPAYSSGREDMVRLDFDGAAFLEEGDVTSFSSVSAMLKPVKGEATAEEGQVQDVETVEEVSAEQNSAAVDNDKLVGKGAGMEKEQEWEEGKKKGKKKKEKDGSDVGK
ncbi:UNVERIFIED_CONTAM: hypothetical protein FKN15_073844 [Acipenser sinensis]